jgi:hypothetical protein
MLAHALPFAATNGYAAVRAKLHDDPIPLGYHLPTLDPALDAIVSRAIARDARERHRSATDMLIRLCRRDESDLVVDASARKERHRWVARLMAVLALAGLGSLVWLSRPDQRPAAADPPAARSR